MPKGTAVTAIAMVTVWGSVLLVVQGQYAAVVLQERQRGRRHGTDAGEATRYIKHLRSFCAGDAIHRAQHDPGLEDVTIVLTAALRNELVAITQEGQAAVKSGGVGDVLHAMIPWVKSRQGGAHCRTGS